MRCGQLLCCSTPSFPGVSVTSLPHFHSLHLSLSLSVCFSRALWVGAPQYRAGRPNGDWARWFGSGWTLTDAPWWESRYKALTAPRSQFSPYDKPLRSCRPPRSLRYRKRMAGINHCRIYSNKLCKQLSTCDLNWTEIQWACKNSESITFEAVW